MHLLVNGSRNNNFLFKVNLDKYILVFRQIHLDIQTNSLAHIWFLQQQLLL